MDKEPSAAGGWLNCHRRPAGALACRLNLRGGMAKIRVYIEEREALFRRLSRPGGGIGRRSRLKIYRQRCLVGSTPTPGTSSPTGVIRWSGSLFRSRQNHRMTDSGRFAWSPPDGCFRKRPARAGRSERVQRMLRNGGTKREKASGCWATHGCDFGHICARKETSDRFSDSQGRLWAIRGAIFSAISFAMRVWPTNEGWTPSALSQDGSELSWALRSTTGSLCSAPIRSTAAR